MAGALRTVMRLLLLLLHLVRTGLCKEDGLIFVERDYDIKFPCKVDLVCFHMWQINTRETSEYVAIVRNGKITAAKAVKKNCTVEIKDLTVEDVGLHRCQERPGVFPFQNTHSTAPVSNLTPAKTVSLQCVLLTFVKQRHCFTQLQQMVELTWVDEAGAEIQQDSQYQINWRSSCDTTLMVTFQSPENKKFRCEATVGEEVQTSVEFRVRAAAFNGKGKRVLIELEPEQQGGNRDVIGAAVGVAGCVILTVVVAVFVVDRRRRSNHLPDEPCADQSSTNNVVNTDDTIYANIIFPAGCDRVWSHECESTEYACVQYK